MSFRALLLAGLATLAGAVGAAPFAYITNQGSHDVSVIDLALDKVVATVPVGRSPAGVVAASRSGKVYVSNPDSKTISVIDMRSQRVVDTLAAGSGPVGIDASPDGTQVLVADWYRNLLADPHVQVWLPDGSWWAGEAQDVTELPDEQRLPLLRQVLINSGFAAYAAGLNPNNMSDAALALATRSYKLVKIRLAEPRTGAGGPSDLAWVWPLVAMGLALLWVRRKR